MLRALSIIDLMIGGAQKTYSIPSFNYIYRDRKAISNPDAEVANQTLEGYQSYLSNSSIYYTMNITNIKRWNGMNGNTFYQ